MTNMNKLTDEIAKCLSMLIEQIYIVKDKLQDSNRLFEKGVKVLLPSFIKLANT